jgi:FdhE protein
MPVMFPDTADPLVRRLDEIADRSPHLARTARLYAAILPLLRDAEPGVVAVSLSPDAAKEKLERGQCLLQDLELELDVRAIAELLLRLAAAAGKAGENVDAAKLRAWFEEHDDELGAVLQDVLEGKGLLLATVAQRLDMDVELCRALVQNALKPDLCAWGRQLAPLSAGGSWKRGTCFVCGAHPVFGELQGNGQALHLRCGLCGADWEYSRLACVHCGNEDHRSREYLFPEGDHNMAHAEACTRCMTYLKVIPAFAPSPIDLLPVEDLATVHLDAAAQERGYRRTSAP